MRREAVQIAVTKILARKGPLADGVDYILNEEKTDRLLIVHLNCDPGRESQEMLGTKRAAGPNGKMDGIQYYHIVQSFKPGEVTPELAEMLAKLAEQDELEITLAGPCTDICVVSNALLIKAFLPETAIRVIADGCAGVTPESHRAALDTMRMCQIQIL